MYRAITWLAFPIQHYYWMSEINNSKFFFKQSRGGRKTKIERQKEEIGLD